MDETNLGQIAEKLDIPSNHLMDTLQYFREFLADKFSLICLFLDIRETLKPVSQKPLRFSPITARKQIPGTLVRL